MSGTLHRISTRHLLAVLRDAQTLHVPLSAELFRKLARTAAMEAETPEQAVRKLIKDYVTDLAPTGRWNTGTPDKPKRKMEIATENG